MTSIMKLTSSYKSLFATNENPSLKFLPHSFYMSKDLDSFY